MVAQPFTIDEADAATGAERLLKFLCQRVGPRPAGSAAMRHAATKLSEEWSALGVVDIHEDAVPVVAWREAPSQVEVVDPLQVTYDSVQAINSASGTVEGPLLVVGNVNAQTLHQLGDSVRGTVVLTKGHQISGGKHITTQQRVCLLQAAGAAAVILASRHPTLPAIEFLYRNNPVAIPVVSISGRDGEALARLVDETPLADARIQTGGNSFQATCLNLVGEVGSSDGASDVIVLSAHLDSFYLSPGAFDNLTGIVTLTEIARVLAPYQDRFVRTLRIIAFTGEEIGFAGSKHYVQTHAEELDRIRLVLNLDGLFDKTARGVAVMWAREMRDYIARALQDPHPEVDVRNLFCMSSDYLPFALRGIPVCRPADWEGPYPIWLHTREDTDDKIPLEWIRANAIVYAGLLFRVLTDRETFPRAPRTPQNVPVRLREDDAEDLVLNWLDFAPPLG